jgi:hypothetical protein
MYDQTFPETEIDATFIEILPRPDGDFIHVWLLKVDLPDAIPFEGCEKYWLSVQGIAEYPPQSGWMRHDNVTLLHEAVFRSEYFGFPDWIPVSHPDLIGWPADMCFQLTYSEAPPPVPAICCEGEIEWTDVAPGEEVTATFEVSNCGEEGSFLDWEICGEPEWGEDWTFDPASGTDLAEGDSVEVEVTVTAPDEENTEFEGEIKACNSEDPDDSCTVSVTLVTPCDMPLFLELLMQRFPILGQILDLIL